MVEFRRAIMPNVINFASIISWGCNLGLGLMAKKCKKSPDITLSALEKTSNWHLLPKNLLDANDRIIQIMDSVPINAVFKEEENLLRSASDGQKYTMALNSIQANYSSKYFGKEKGIIIYSFMAEHYPVVYTTTFSAGEFEAWFILDGLLHYQPVLQPKPKRKEKAQIIDTTNTDEIREDDDEESNRLHSTDQHGINSHASERKKGQSRTDGGNGDVTRPIWHCRDTELPQCHQPRRGWSSAAHPSWQSRPSSRWRKLR